MKAPVAQAESNKEKWLVLPPSLQLAAWGLTLCVFYLSSTYTEQNGIGLLPRTAVSLRSVKDYRFLHPHPLARHLIRWRVPHSIPELNFKGGTKSYQKMNSFCLNFAENWLGWANIDIFYPFLKKKKSFAFLVYVQRQDELLAGCDSSMLISKEYIYNIGVKTTSWWLIIYCLKFNTPNPNSVM